ncbi:MAG: hypothetical protein QF632_00825, partial [Candidatus Woesearchaeota archaeon]|nr:hypothetical protein [Candidatus Woesearchaeota archaeon]
MKEMIKSLTTGENQDKIIPLKSQNFGDIPKEIMNITKFINFENYYCQITPLFRELLNNRISNYSSTARQINSSSNTVRRILKIENYFININTLINLGNNHGIQRSTVLKNICSIKTKTSFPVEFNLKDLISPSLFRVIGNFLGDGGIHTNVPEGKYRPFYANQSHTLINQFVIDIKKLFGDFKIYQRRKPTNVKEVWLPTTLGHFFFELLEYD